MPFTTQVVPMPRWSTPVGCSKLALALVILAFVAACTAIWGAYPAFIVSLLTASFSLLAFGYYMVALSFKPACYNKWVVLVLESMLTLFWLLSLILLAEWTDVSSGTSRWIWQRPISYHSTPKTVNLSRRNSFDDLLAIWDSPLGMTKSQALSTTTTAPMIHGQDAQQAARVLSGIAAGLAGVTFALYTATLITFSINFTKTTESQTTSDEEAPPAPTTRTDTHRTTSTIQSGPPNPPAISAALRVDTLPKEFEPKPQTQEHYLTPEQAAEAGIEPPTPILKAQMAEKEKEKEKIEEGKGKHNESLASGALSLKEISPVSPLVIEKQEMSEQ